MNKIYAHGIDTSKWQKGKVDYHKFKQSGGTFVFLRIGYNKTKDSYFDQDYEACINAGLKVGAYYYPLSTNSVEAEYDATRVLGWLNNRHLDFPVVYDVEDNKQKGVARRDINSDMYNAFRRRIESGGIYDAMLYTGEYFFNTYFNKALIKDDIWIAKYSSVEPEVNRKVSIWQYSSSEIDTDYFKGKLDRNYMLVEKFQESAISFERITDNPYPIPTRNLKRTYPAMRGNDVKWLQWELHQEGYLAEFDIDGIFGNKTKECVIQYQGEYKLKQDGIVGSATRYCMINY